MSDDTYIDAGEALERHTGNPAYQGWAYSPFSACLWSAQRLLTYVYMSGNDPTGPRNCPDSQTPRTLDSCFVPAAGASSAAWLSVDTRCETNLMDTAVRVVPGGCPASRGISVAVDVVVRRRSRVHHDAR